MPENPFKNWFEEFLNERCAAYNVTYENERHKTLSDRIQEILKEAFKDKDPSLLLELDELKAEAEWIKEFANFRRGFWTGYELAKILAAGEKFPLAGPQYLEAMKSLESLKDQAS